MQALVDKVPHKNLPYSHLALYTRFSLHMLDSLNVSNDQLLSTLVDRICQIDSDIKSSKNPSFLAVKVLDDKELKLDMVLSQVLAYISNRFSIIKGNTEKEEEFADILLTIMENRVFPL